MLYIIAKIINWFLSIIKLQIRVFDCTLYRCGGSSMGCLYLVTPHLSFPGRLKTKQEKTGEVEKNLGGGQWHTVKINMAKCHDAPCHISTISQTFVPDNISWAMFMCRCRIRRRKPTPGMSKYLRQKHLVSPWEKGERRG